MKKQLSERQKEEWLEVLMLAAKDKRLLDAFLKDLLTPAEYREIVTRWQILKQLEQGIGQRTISKNLEIGISTITRGSRVLDNPAGGANQLLDRLLTKK
jgi:TrpR family transcriptional regulator, trp operon repressor